MKKVAITVSVILNVLVLGIAAWFFTGGATQILTEYFIQPMHQRWLTQFDQYEVEFGDTVFLGDSITEGGSWHELFPNDAVRNRGIGGDVTTGVLARLEKIIEGQPARVFLLIGTNDLGLGAAEKDIANNIVSIVENIRDRSPNTAVYVQSVLPRAASYQQQVESLNQLIKDGIAGSATWVNLYPLFPDKSDGSIKNEFSNDELHLHGAGYVVWRDAIVSFMGP